MAKKKSTTRKLLYTLGVLIIVFGIGAGFASYKGWIGGEPAGTEVETSKAKLKTITQIVSASGKIQPEVEVLIRPDVSGEIIELNVKEGDYVKQGDLLLRIKPDIYQAKIDELQAALLTQKARLEQQKANYLEAQNQFERQKQLFEKGAVSEAEYDQAKTNMEAQKASYNAAKYQVQSSEAQLRRAEEELQQTVIRAPRDGTISKLNVETGERVLGNAQVAGTELLRIARMDQMEVQVEVNENDIVNVSHNDTARIEVDAYPDKKFNGVVTEIANSANVNNQGTQEQVTNYEVKIRITTPHNLDMAGINGIKREKHGEIAQSEFSPTFKPGMSATVDVETQTVKNAVAVPIQAVTVRDFASDKARPDTAATEAPEQDTTREDLLIPEEDLRKVVFKVEDGQANRYEVRTGISDNTHIQVLSGVDVGDVVVIGSYKVLSRELVDGDKVKVNNNKFQAMASGDSQ